LPSICCVSKRAQPRKRASDSRSKRRRNLAILVTHVPDLLSVNWPHGQRIIFERNEQRSSPIGNGCQSAKPFPANRDLSSASSAVHHPRGVASCSLPRWRVFCCAIQVLRFGVFMLAVLYMPAATASESEAVSATAPVVTAAIVKTENRAPQRVPRDFMFSPPRVGYWPSLAVTCLDDPARGVSAGDHRMLESMRPSQQRPDRERLPADAVVDPAWGLEVCAL
jgi:hypothetical protein